ncbi:GntR family transcriptional regulator [Algicella marina]|uniref:FCD domain-containing protein n=1 Tax=Algicella marina TaxID=2683284 RepID=A0A6P1T0G2_9RHOB|nr:GntR family transcriptional regulator [Algicella marina]QHQ35123.1 FCD domain-containing protein [Algicella marina]
MTEIIADEHDELEGLPALDEMSGPLSQRVYLLLRSAILDLTFPPGRVLRKGTLCDRLGVSRSPVSDAITRLATEGLLDVIPQSATRVRRLSLVDLREESFLREAIETAAVRKVAEEREEAALEQLSRNFRLQCLLVEDGDFRGFFEADEAFHTLILGFTGYRKLASALSQMSLNIRRARLLLLPEANRPAETVEEHDAILAAIRDRDPDAAAQAMRFHLGQLISRIEPLEKRHPDYFRRGQSL